MKTDNVDEKDKAMFFWRLSFSALDTVDRLGFHSTLVTYGTPAANKFKFRMGRGTLLVTSLESII